MSDIKHREKKMQKVAQETSFRDFLKSIASWFPLNLYKKNGKLSMYDVETRCGEIRSPEDFEKERDGLEKYGLVYDFSKNFFQNYQELFLRTPKTMLVHVPELQNSDFTASAGRGIKNAYLSFIVCLDVQNILYSLHVKQNCADVCNSVMVRDNSSNIYRSSGILKSYNVFYSRYIYNSNNIRFSTNLIGCSECIKCSNLQNQSYCIENIPYSKEEYLERKKELLQEKGRFLSYFLNIDKTGSMMNSENCTGSYIINSENVRDGYYTYQVKNGKNLVLFGSQNGNKEAYNILVSGAPNNDMVYNMVNSGGNNNTYNSELVLGGENIYYSYYVENCSYCLGCIGLKNKSFCILNKQYTQEEWFELANKIFAQMEEQGILGKYFSGSINPFYFNDTLANLIDDFTKEEVTAEGYLWRDEEIKVDIPAGAEIVKTSELNDFQGFNEKGERHINPEILKKVIQDEKGNYYRIVPMELEFLQKHGLPLPEIHWLERIKLGFKFK